MDNLFFIASKLIAIVISPAAWLILIPCLAWLLSVLQHQVMSRLLWVVEIALVMLIGFFSVGQWLVHPLETRFSRPSADVIPDGVIVLGGAWLTDGSEYWQQWEMNRAAERDIALVALSRQFPSARLVFTGGSGKLTSQHNKEATYARMMYSDLGVDLDRVTFESNSRNTYENGVFTKELVQPQEGEVWWLITSAYHMPRSVGIFCTLGWAVQAYPVDHIYEGGSGRPLWAFEDHLLELKSVLREWVGLVVYRITGKTSVLLPQQHDPC